MNQETNDGPGLSVPPPVLYVVALLIGVGLNYLWPTSPLPDAWRYIIGIILIVASILIMPPVLARFRRAGTPFDVRRAASTLITDGPYRFSRHPSYVSLTLLYLGVGFLLNNGWVFASSLPLLVVMDRWVVAREERHLEAKFGEEYRRYKSVVRRWL